VALREKIERETLAARREMVRAGELVGEDEFRERLHVSANQLVRMVAKGNLFTIDVDDVEYFPSLLAAPELDLRRLHSICRILVPAPPSCRLWYLSSRRVNLGGISPIDALHDDESYRLLRRMARAYGAEWWRTSVTICIGQHEEKDNDAEAILTAIAEIDPRVNIWKRATDALRSGGYIHPCGPYPRATVATVFIACHYAVETAAINEARIDVSVEGGIVRAFVVCGEERGYELDAIPVDDADGIVDVVLRIVSTASTKG